MSLDADRIGSERDMTRVTSEVSAAWIRRDDPGGGWQGTLLALLVALDGSRARAARERDGSSPSAHRHQ
jgi:hypothetical protein